MRTVLIILSVFSTIAVIYALYAFFKSCVDLKKAEKYYEELFDEKWK